MAWTYRITSSVPWSHLSAEENAEEIWSFFYGLGFTLEAVAGILGNMEHESYLNPGQGEIGSGGGLGLIQWTPSTELTNYVIGNWYNGYAQLDVINREGTGNIRSKWIPTTSYPYSWAQFSQLTDVDLATRAYLAERERAGVAALSARLAYAKHWYEYLGGVRPVTRRLGWLPGAVSSLKRRKII